MAVYQREYFKNGKKPWFYHRYRLPFDHEAGMHGFLKVRYNYSGSPLHRPDDQAQHKNKK